MDWVSPWLTTRIDFELYSVDEEDVAEWTFLRRNPFVCSAFQCPIWAALTSVGSITFGRLTLWSSFSSCLCPSWSVFVLCQTTNNPVGCSTSLASLARPSSIRSWVEFSFNDYNLPSFCKPRSMQHFFSDSSRTFLSSLFFSACLIELGIFY